jgi:hypothetical protein
MGWVLGRRERLIYELNYVRKSSAISMMVIEFCCCPIQRAQQI